MLTASGLNPTTYGAYHRWKDKNGNETKLEVTGYPSMQEAQQRIIDCLKQDKYRLPRWFEFWRTEYIPGWLRDGLKAD